MLSAGAEFQQETKQSQGREGKRRYFFGGDDGQESLFEDLALITDLNGRVGHVAISGKSTLCKWSRMFKGTEAEMWLVTENSQQVGMMTVQSEGAEVIQHHIANVPGPRLFQSLLGQSKDFSQNGMGNQLIVDGMF